MQCNLAIAQFWKQFLAFTSAVPCHTPNNANLNLQHTYWDRPKDVIRNSNCTHSQRRTCTPCWEHVGRFITKLLNTTLTQNAFCKIDLKSKQSWDNRLTDPEDRLHLLYSQLSNHFIPISCWALWVGDYLTLSLTLLERQERNMTVRKWANMPSSVLFVCLCISREIER